MTYLIKLYPEITIKSRSVRQQMTRCLTSNIRNTLKRHDEGVRVRGRWDAIQVRLSPDLDAARVRDAESALTRISGIHQILAAEEIQIDDLTSIAEHVVPLWGPEIAGQRFRVKAKRRGQHDFSSMDLERYLGARLLEAAPDAQVDLTTPEVIVPVEVTHNRLQLIRAKWPGLGGFPMGIQGQVLSLISGGFDSPVAAWRMMRRGVKSHFVFFNLGGPAHEAGVREVTHHLWQRYSASHNVHFISVPFEGVIGEILKTIPDGLMGVVLKRMMVRAASRIAERADIPALVTGDAIAQVSSQTLSNLALIDAASPMPILRPLLTEDKQAIIDQARQIDTARHAEVMPEYCGVISKRPHIKADPAKVAEAEVDFDFGVLDAAIEEAVTTRSNRLLERPAPVSDDALLVIDSPEALGSVDAPCVIDIRAPHEREDAPLELDRVPQLQIPFYELQERAPTLDTDHHYLLFCDQGVMSRMQALHLMDRGLRHFGIYRRP
ncbi:tRNA 4-thiouridine(8) synthase ThiI [Halomonas eurihalina]|uniref:Probable tRNA sulfurtransferase n=1 Tax=Halomonas eurihalina TaxID=42566 RepID=A0A5D9D4S7_HALER|nr:tRNA uracil 4-sulfurtransferase ThiI [Halomonas eurihalina]MDR5858785.1 tRNA 4-thiouridine(8) synthase ThiI [Halomonas eurihalina]TZG38924.1 tRNA 4-thiouridine(8) synthase ThiI [Halomonas eurihalina]